MIKETMTREQRIEAVINHRPPDRLPVMPQMFQFPLRYKGLPVVPLAGGNPADWPKMLQAYKDTEQDLGGFDFQEVAGITWPISSWRINSALGGRYITPGTEGIAANAEVQYVEQEAIKFEDYDTIIDKGWNGFLQVAIPRQRNMSVEQLDTYEKYLLDYNKKELKYWRDKGYPVLCGALLISNEMTLSLGRTMPKFTMDLHRHPQKVKAALEAMTADFIDNNLKDMEAFGVPWVVISLERGSGAYFSLKTYEEYFFPHLKKEVEAFVAHGARCILHFDTNWTKNLPYLRELPTNSLICQFDSITDIFKAKEVIGDRICIMGDMPASILSLGTKDDVAAYCEKLIDVVGKDGGFIMSSGCEVPPDAKFENVKVMVDSVKNHPYPRS